MMKRIIVYIFCAAAIGGITITPHVHCKNNVHKHRDPLERLSDTKTGRSTAEESFRKLEHPRSVEDGDAIDITNKPTEGELNPLIIFGSSNSTGNTWKTICAFNTDGLIPVVDLNTLDITPYDYAHKNKDDDYLPLMERIMHHNPIILATPVYWYTPSAVMKTFIDRLSDLLTIRKDLGRGLANKDLYVITSYGARKPNAFEESFRQICGYMDMHYKGCYYHYAGKDAAQVVADDVVGKFRTAIGDRKKWIQADS